MSNFLRSFSILLILLLTSIQPLVHANDDRVATFDPNAYQEMVAEQQARKAVHDPEGFHNGIEDITHMNQFGAMTAEMAKFYWAVAALEFTHCFIGDDSTGCTQFIESLKDPVGHIGFALFMKTNKMTVDLSHMITRGKINPGMASYLGLATGMMAQSVFQDIYYHPIVKELFATSSIKDDDLRVKTRKEVLNKLWKHFRSNAGSYLFNKIPNVMGLLGAAYLSHKTVQALGHIFTKSERLVQFAFKPQTAETIIKFGKTLHKHRRFARSGLKFFWQGSKLVRVHPVVALGSYLVETVIFLVWAPIVEEFLVRHWDRYHATNKIEEAKENLDKAIRRGAPSHIIKMHTKSLAKGFDEYRKSIMHKAEMTKMRHMVSIQSVDAELQKKVMYYEWLASGMDMESDLYKLNELDFHDGRLIQGINEAASYAEDFFCGKSAKDAVSRSVDISGIPMPFTWDYDYNFDKNRTYYENMRSNDGMVSPTGVSISSFKAYHIDGLCDRDIRLLNPGKSLGNYDKIVCPLDYDYTNHRVVWRKNITHTLFCKVDQSNARQKILSSGRLKGENIRDDIDFELNDMLGEIMEKVWSQRDLMIMRYERVIRKDLAEALTGKSAVLKYDDSLYVTGSAETTYFWSGSIPLGYIPHLEYEMSLWVDYMTGNQSARPYYQVFREKLRETSKKKSTASDLLKYTKKSYSQRVRNVNMFQEVPKEDWQKIIMQLREFVIP
ncbi:MAG: hypothetical protein HOJ35_03305 [Bdellovibrionales bacterium]|nr:hypothetical protein [Bdellovibrionales bacterium]